MIEYDWCTFADYRAKASQDIWHAVAPQMPKTVCGLPVANPDEEWRWVGSLGRRRSCDNCARILALEADFTTALKATLKATLQVPQGEPMNPNLALVLKYGLGALLFVVYLAASATPPWAGITIGQPILAAIFAAAWASLGLGAYQGYTAVVAGKR